MAYIVGLVDKKEKEILEKRGWKVEPPNLEELSSLSIGDLEMVMIFVDSGILDIMSGPDWDISEKK